MSLLKSTPRLLSLTIGLVYLWFGFLKFFPGTSPAEELASDTIRVLSFELLDGNYSLVMLAFWESLVGLMLLFNTFRGIAIQMALVHILFTFTPLLIFPERVFAGNLLQPTLLGQYITKNIIIVGVLLVLWKDYLETRNAYVRGLISQKARS